MPAIFVHGNPETSAIWDLLIPELDRDRDDVLTLSPPGFGAPCPVGWGGTRLDYLAWLIGELERIDGPIDLVAIKHGETLLLDVKADSRRLVKNRTIPTRITRTRTALQKQLDVRIAYLDVEDGKLHITDHAADCQDAQPLVLT